MGDPIMELRTMILLSLPFPPIPIQASRIESDETRFVCDAVVTSHDIIAQCLNMAALRSDQVANTRRREKQHRDMLSFMQTISKEGYNPEPEELYALYQHHTRSYIESFFLGRNEPEIRFKPLDYVANGDNTHMKMCEHLAAQTILYEDDVERTSEYFLSRSYSSLLFVLMQRFRNTQDTNLNCSDSSIKGRAV